VTIEYSIQYILIVINSIQFFELLLPIFQFHVELLFILQAT
jgi:hypothetical protein